MPKSPEQFEFSKESDQEKKIETQERKEKTLEKESGLERRSEGDKERLVEQLEQIREQIQQTEPRQDKIKAYDKPIDLTEEEQVTLKEEIKALKAGLKLKTLARVFVGNITATEYDSQIRNFSTETKITTLSSGKKLFLVHNFKTSFVHRIIDNTMKRLTGTKIHKATSAEWKKQFENKSTIPIIPNEDPNTIILPYIPNLNLRDLFARKDEIKDFGECSFAENIEKDQLLEIIDKVVDKAKELHDKDTTWGELALHNIIIDRNQNIHICDPETEYYPDVPILERKARDMLNFIFSAAAHIHKSTSLNHAVVAKRVLDRYGDQRVTKEVKDLAQQKPSFLNKITFGHLQTTFGFKDYQEYEKIKQDIVNCIEGSNR